VGYPTGHLLRQVLPAVEPQLSIPASVPLAKLVSRVSFCLVGYPPQGGWLLGLRSDRVRQKLPVPAASCRHVLPLAANTAQTPKPLLLNAI